MRHESSSYQEKKTTPKDAKQKKLRGVESISLHPQPLSPDIATLIQAGKETGKAKSYKKETTQEKEAYVQNILNTVFLPKTHAAEAMRIQQRAKEKPLKEKQKALTEKQKEVLILVAQGKDLHAIARNRKIARSTVTGHIRAIKRRYGVASTKEAVLHALKNNDIPQTLLEDTKLKKEAFANLSVIQKNFLDALISDLGSISSHRDLARVLHKSKPTIHTTLNRMNRKFGTMNMVHLAAVYYSYRQANPEPGINLQ